MRSLLLPAGAGEAKCGSGAMQRDEDGGYGARRGGGGWRKLPVVCTATDSSQLCFWPALWFPSRCQEVRGTECSIAPRAETRSPLKQRGLTWIGSNADFAFPVTALNSLSKGE